MLTRKKKRKVFYTTQCKEHGRESVINHEMEVRVPTPRSRAHCVSGCPQCKRKAS